VTIGGVLKMEKRKMMSIDDSRILERVKKFTKQFLKIRSVVLDY